MTDWQDALFAPRRVAVVGASASPRKAGALFLRNLTALEAGFEGEVVAIHPSASELLGCPAYPSLAAVPGPVDLAIVVTPPAAVPNVIADCGAAGVPVAIVISGGFAETGRRGVELQREVAGMAAARGVRILGPNCFGVINTACGLNGSLSIGLPSRGGISLLTQSGAYGMAAYGRSTDDGTGFAKIVALGNKLDLDDVELLEFLGRDPETRVVAMLLESISDGRGLFEAAAAVATRKPIVALKTGRHPDAQRAAASHTAALSGDAAVIFAALRQAGVHLVEDGLALLDVAASLDRQPPLRGRNIGIVTNSGGTGVELTDLLESKGLAVPALSPGLQAKIASQLPPQGSAVNPIDVATDWERFAAMYEFAVEALMTSEEVDAVVPVLLQRSALMPEVGDVVIAASARARERGSLKPIHVCWVAPRSADANRKKLQAAGVPCHAWPGATATILAGAVSRPLRPLARLSAREPILQPAAVDDAGWLTSAAAFSLLQQSGFPVARWMVVTDPAAAAAAAAKMQFPVVLKAERPKLAHKSDAGAVRLGLTDGAAVAEAFEDFSRRLGAGPALLQRQEGPGVELILGARRDPLFGPIVMAGLGGVWTEVLDDVALRLAPIDADEARTMLDELKGHKVLAGFRGRPPIDLIRFARLIGDLSQWFCAAAWLSELDLNPIIANGDDFTIVDARMRVVNSSRSLEQEGRDHGDAH
ncbi:acetate--CoA ligase family protein [Methylocapsa aurea]|uniref:acetate--CoA ligase family protein n=1 Tax=Methylocapsa aurea TaxID=663610 RepID=UPI000567B59B|nr:acetate--CoA ligase family protein [Methylocapsa aurea]